MPRLDSATVSADYDAKSCTLYAIYIYIYICISICWAIYGNGLSAPASFLDEESFFRLEAISVSRGPGNGQVVLWVCAASEGHSINEFEEDCGSGTLPVIPFKV